jgi:hypothetical protein
MKSDINFNDAVDFSNQDSLLLKRRENRMLLSDYQVMVLKNNGIDYKKYSNFHDLLFDVEEILFNDYDDELDLVSGQIQEMVYYSDTKK